MDKLPTTYELTKGLVAEIESVKTLLVKVQTTDTDLYFKLSDLSKSLETFKASLNGVVVSQGELGSKMSAQDNKIAQQAKAINLIQDNLQVMAQGLQHLAQTVESLK